MTHETVGWRLRAGSAVYRCTRYTPSGFDMLLIEGEDMIYNPPRRPGYVANVSERAIGRTYHKVYHRDEKPTPHELPCVCHICNPKDWL